MHMLIALAIAVVIVVIGFEVKSIFASGKPMTRKELEQLRKGVKAQLRRAVLNGGDQELLELLRLHHDRLSSMISECPSGRAPERAA